MEGKISLPTASQNNHPLSDDAEHSNHSICCSQRLIVVLMGFLGGVMLETNRSNLSVAIVCMVNDTTGNYINGTKTTQTQSENAEFYWSKGEQSGILSAYFYGYMVTQLPSGILAAKYGGKYVMFIGMLIGSTASLLLPIGARTSIYLVYALRVILGLGMGVYNPTMQAIIGRWAPPLERTILTAICYSGFSFGIIATFTISGYMCIYGFDHGWGSIFYVPGAISMLWCCLWCITIASTPAQHPRISKRERNYIIHGIGETSQQTYKTPWAAILTSPAFRAFVVGHVCFAWLVYTLTTNTPTFFKEVLNFDIAENGLLSAVPSTSQTVFGLLAGQVSDYLRSRKYLSTTATRRIFQSIAFLGAGACLVGTGFMDAERRYVAVFLLAAAMAFMGLATAGVLVNTADFAPRYAGILFGISNTVATTPGMLAPLLAGILTPNKTQEEWRNVFYVCGGVCILGTLVFGTQARGELQPWAVEQATVDVGEGQDVPGGLTNDAVVNGRLEKNTTFMSTHL
ncbi:uncharacterized transporter slc-17.2-like [Haliotis rufescens]|uniref:uncharacterized transporter slc-17.2-like n=1 Tax=Haliotis rufescens TaxID=6454 RepID=UPI00201F3BF9|nr:uncharacterized transporter slc-17.2-like [Haliotis rufescens]XP_048250213.1 uncharacterized transporter slc-17.2-like [Haliotis rufescens]